MQPGSETDMGFWAQALDRAWALVLVIIVPLFGWAFRHENRITTLEYQHKECERDRARAIDVTDAIQASLKDMNTKLDQLIGRISK